MDNSKTLAEIQSKYQDCNLLIPAATSVQINPFYKCTVIEVIADTSQNSGDIFKVGNTKIGEDRDGNAVYADVFSPAKPLLMKLATAAGIQFHPEYTTVIRENANTYVGRAYGAVRLPDGTYKAHSDTKRICLDDEEAKYRLEFMDKSIMGIHDWRSAKAASEMFKGEWKEDSEKKNKWGNPEKYYVIADSDREKYIERSILVNMTLLRKTASEKAQTGAILRVIRALLGIKGTYQLQELKKPFAVPTVTFSPDYSDVGVRQAMLQQGMNSMGNMFGTAALPPAVSFHTEAFPEEAFTEPFNPEDNLDNPVFASGIPANDGATQQKAETEENWFAQDAARSQQDTPEKAMGGKDGDLILQDLYCDQCGEHISDKVYEFSIEKFGRPLCFKCQKGAGK